jgi:hypothetical protein
VPGGIGLHGGLVQGFAPAKESFQGLLRSRGLCWRAFLVPRGFGDRPWPVLGLWGCLYCGLHSVEIQDDPSPSTCPAHVCGQFIKNLKTLGTLECRVEKRAKTPGN